MHLSQGCCSSVACSVAALLHALFFRSRECTGHEDLLLEKRAATELQHTINLLINLFINITGLGNAPVTRLLLLGVIFGTFFALYGGADRCFSCSKVGNKVDSKMAFSFWCHFC